MSDNSSIEKKIETEKSHNLHSVVSITADQLGDENAIITTIISPSGKKVEVTGDVDEAMKLAMNSGPPIVIDEATNSRILRKTDLYLMPLLCFLYSVQFMDKVSNSYASIMGLKQDLDMTGDKYTWVGSGFYLGYLFFEFPSSFLLQRFPMAKVASTFIVLWGIVLCLHATPNYGGFIFLRVLLGMLESAVTPSMVILTSQWYKKEEQFIRSSIWFCFNGWGTIMGSSIAYGLAIHSESYSIAAWKVLFIITGLMTIIVGIVFYFHIPDTPLGAWFLTEEEKMLVVERIRGNNQGFGNRHFKMHQFKEALLDHRTWICFFFGLASDIPNGGLTNFGSILLSTDFKYGHIQALLMGMPAGAVEIVGCWLLGYCHKFFPQRLPIAIFLTIITLVSACMLAFAEHSKNARLAGYYLMSVSPVGMICCLSLFSSNVAGHTKKVVVNLIFLIGYCTGNIVGPQTFRNDQAPNYNGAKIAIVATYAVSLVLLGLLYVSYWVENKRRDKLAAERGEDEIFMENQEFADLTDFENPHFRYQL